MVDEVLTHLYMELLIIILQSWHHFHTESPPPIQIFSNNLPNHFSCPADLWSFKQSTSNCYMPNTLPLLNVIFIPACWRPRDPGIIFHLLMPLKNMSAWYGIISIHLLKHFKGLWRTFPHLDRKFQVYLLLGAHNRISWKRVEGKKCNGCRKISYMLPRYHVSPIAHTVHPIPLLFRQTLYNQ